MTTTVNLQRNYGYVFEISTGLTYIQFVASIHEPDIYAQMSTANAYSGYFILDTANPSDPPNNKFNSINDGLTYCETAMWSYILNGMNNFTAVSGQTFVAGTIETIPFNAYPFRADWNQTNTSAYDYIKNKPSFPALSFANPSVSLNSAAQISTTRNAQVTYSVDIACTMSLTSGQSGTVILEYADDSGFTTNVKTVARATSSNSGTLTIGLALTQIGAANLSGIIPAGKYRRLRTVNNTSTPTFTMMNSQEVLI